MYNNWPHVISFPQYPSLLHRPSHRRRRRDQVIQHFRLLPRYQRSSRRRRPPPHPLPSLRASPLLPTPALPHCASPPSPRSSHHRPPPAVGARRPPAPSPLIVAGRHLRARHRRNVWIGPDLARSGPPTPGFHGNKAVLLDSARQRLDSTGLKLWQLDLVRTRPSVMSPWPSPSR